MDIGAYGRISIFSWLIIFHCYTHTHYIFFIHLSVDVHLDCFHILAIMNNTSINLGMPISKEISNDLSKNRKDPDEMGSLVNSGENPKDVTELMTGKERK